jgi:predicted transcriptional regulator of viral defense system
MNHSKSNYLSDFIIDLQSKGRYSFSLPELRSFFKIGNEALKQSLRRLAAKNRICPVRRNFYVIVPPEYLVRRIVPPVLFVDDLMRFIGKPYYVALLSAAALHGAAHQQPQEFFVITVKPALRRISVRGVVINFVIRSAINSSLTMQKQTDTGYCTVAGPELTALDCVCFPRRIGGLNRAAEVIGELIPMMTRNGIQKLAKADFPSPVLQRLGFLLERNPEGKNLSDALFHSIKRNISIKVPLSPAGTIPAQPATRWKIVENIKLELDE